MNGNGATTPIEWTFDYPDGGTIRATPGHSKPWVWVSSRDGGGLHVIQRLAEAHDLDWRKLIDTPALLGKPLNARPPRQEPLRPLAWYRSCAYRLRSGAPALDWLQGRRGVSLSVLRASGVGYDAATGLLTFPMLRHGSLVAAKTRAPADGARMLCPAGPGRPWPLYMLDRVRDEGEVIVAEGELDALCGLSHGLVTCSVTLGAGTWLPAWTEDLRGLRVAICFDNDAQGYAHQRVATLQAAGIEARNIALPRRLGPKGDLSDYLLGRRAGRA